MKNVNELKAGALLSYVNIALGCIIPLFYTPIMLKMLGQAEYGVYSLSNSVISYLSLLNLGMGSAVMRYVTKCRAENNKEGVERITGLFTMIYLGLGVLVCVVGLFLSLCADRFFSSGLTADEVSRLKILMVIMTLSTAVSFPVSVFSSICGAYEKYIFRRVLDIASTVALPILNLIVLYNGGKSIGMAVVGLFVQLAYAPIFILYCIRCLGIVPKFGGVPKEVIRDIWSFSGFVFLSMIVDLLYWSTDKVLIGAALGSVAVAVYNVGSVFTSMLQNMSSAISNVFVPRITTMVVKNRSMDELSQTMIKVGRLQYLVVSLILSGYIVFGQRFIHFWSGDEYADAYYVALLTMIPLAVPLIQNVAYNTILAQKKHQFRAIIYAVIAVVNIISTWLVLPYYGIIGAAACTGIAYAVGNGLIMNIYYARVTKLNIVAFWKNIGWMSIVPSVLILLGYYLCNRMFVASSMWGFLVQVVLYSVVFVGASWVFSMNVYEKNLFIDLFKKMTQAIKHDP